MAKARATVDVNAYSSTIRKVLSVDENGYPTGKSAATVYASNLIPLQTVVTNATVVSGAVEIDGFEKLNIYVKTSTSFTVYLQTSIDGVLWYDVKSIADADITFNCNNELICAPYANVVAFYARVVVKAVATGTVVVDLLAG